MDAIFIMRRMQEEYQKKDKLYMCFVDMEKAFDRVPRKVMEWATRKRVLSEVMVWAVMSLYDGAKTRVGWDLHIQRNSKQGSVLSPLLLAIVVDVITKNARRDVVNELLYVDDLVLMGKTTDDLKERFMELEGCAEKVRV